MASNHKAFCMTCDKPLPNKWQHKRICASCQKRRDGRYAKEHAAWQASFRGPGRKGVKVA